VAVDDRSVPVAHHAGTAPMPWYLWCAALAVTSAYVGGYWDISWHRSIGRDTFWSAPHIAIYACGILAGLSCGYLILSATFERPHGVADASVRIWGFRGPLGAFICAWGGIAMIASAPFDDWWHGAYGLDVRIISPPHMVLAAGFFSIIFGSLVLLSGFVNRTSGAARVPLQRLFLYVGGVAMSESLLVKLEYIDRSNMHTALFYRVVALGTPLFLIALATASRHRWACTIMASVYTAFNLALLWILPLFPAQPKLGPVYQPVTHFIPWEFPLLVIVPCAVVDLLLQRTAAWRTLPRAVAIGAAFLVTFALVQWPFANFLMTAHARNWFFGAHYMDYGTPPRSLYARFLFEVNEPTRAAFWQGMGIALVTSIVMAWVGLYGGRRLQRVQR
jgi:hypothetical protein